MDHNLIKVAVFLQLRFAIGKLFACYKIERVSACKVLLSGKS
jgi:hypothetical protein